MGRLLQLRLAATVCALSHFAAAPCAARPLRGADGVLPAEIQQIIENAQGFSVGSQEDAVPEPVTSYAAASLLGELEDFPIEDSPLSSDAAFSFSKHGEISQLSQSKSVLLHALRRANPFSVARDFFQAHVSSTWGISWPQRDFLSDPGYDSSPPLFAFLQEKASMLLRGQEASLTSDSGYSESPEFAEDTVYGVSSVYDLPIDPLPVPDDSQIPPLVGLTSSVLDKARRVAKGFWDRMVRARHYI